jgi:hypothetical protein
MNSQLFEALFVAWAKRDAVRSLGEQKNAMITALYGNPNFDGKDGEKARRSLIDTWDRHFREAVQRIVDPRPDVTAEDMKRNAFLRPAIEKAEELQRQSNGLATNHARLATSYDLADIDQA